MLFKFSDTKSYGYIFLNMDIYFLLKNIFPWGKEKVRNKISKSSYTKVHGNLKNFDYVSFVC